MEMNPVTSSNLSSMGYDEDTSTMAVQFNNGSVYSYQDVSKETYETVLHADSVGSTFNQLIVKGGYTYEKQS
jgi:hypothetical protein